MESAETSSDTNCFKSAAGRVFSGGPVYMAFAAFFAVLLIAGVISGIHAVYIADTREAYGASREIPLAMLIATYAFFVVISTGLCLVSSIGHVFGVRNFMPVARRAVLLSAVTIMSGFLVIGLELENPFRLAIYMFLSPNFSSNIWWMGVLYAFELVFLVIEFIFVMRNNHKVSAVAGFFALFFGVAAISNLGGVFATINGRAYWHGPYLPIFLIVSALTVGCAVIIFFTVIAYRMKGEPLDAPTADSLAAVAKLAVIMLAVVLFFTIWRMVMMTTSGTEMRLVLDALISGRYARSFWIFEIGLGIVVPFLLFLWSGGKRIGMMFIASALMIFSIFFVRLNMVVLGEIVPLYWELGVREYSRLNVYSPTWHEILVVLGGVGFCGLAFMLGEKVFSGFSEDQCVVTIESRKAQEAT